MKADTNRDSVHARTGGPSRQDNCPHDRARSKPMKVKRGRLCCPTVPGRKSCGSNWKPAGRHSFRKVIETPACWAGTAGDSLVATASLRSVTGSGQQPGNNPIQDHSSIGGNLKLPIGNFDPIVLNKFAYCITV